LEASIRDIEAQADTMTELDAKLLELTQYLLQAKGRGDTSGMPLVPSPAPLAVSVPDIR
jgi:hypothetical protein